MHRLFHTHYLLMDSHVNNFPRRSQRYQVSGWGSSLWGSQRRVCWTTTATGMASVFCSSQAQTLPKFTKIERYVLTKGSHYVTSLHCAETNELIGWIHRNLAPMGYHNRLSLSRVSVTTLPAKMETIGNACTPFQHSHRQDVALKTSQEASDGHFSPVNG